MSTRDDGGPAFPRPAFTPGFGQHDNAAEAGFANTGAQGMSLRDWFAGQALAGWLASFGDDAQHPAHPAHCGRGLDVAWYSYAIADAMLAARKAKP